MQHLDHKMKILFGCIALQLLSGCSSWELKERCEKTNWFEYSRDLANSGRYLEEDPFLKDCKGVDRTSAEQLDRGFKSGRERYCTYENFFRNGESGEPVNFKMCDNLILYQMQERYAGGLNQFCTAEVGYTYGASGKVYKNVCIKKQEDKFIPEYFHGRYEYLKKSIAQLTADISSLERLQSQVKSQMDQLSHEINNLPSPQVCQTLSVYNPSTQKSENQRVCEEAPYIRSRRSQLYSEIDPLRSQYAEHGFILNREVNSLSYSRTELTKIPTAYAVDKLP